jgi:lipid A disaccharide synthetase
MKRHWVPFLEAAVKFAEYSRESWTVLIPIASTLDLEECKARFNQWQRSQGERQIPRFLIVSDPSGVVLRAAHLGLIKSGTSTLEAAVLDCPMVVAYRPGRLTSFLVKNILKYRFPVGLVNLFRGWKPGDRMISPEVLHEQMTAENLARELWALYSSPERMTQMRADFEQLRGQMLLGDEALLRVRAVDAVLEVVSRTAK